MKLKTGVSVIVAIALAGCIAPREPMTMAKLELKQQQRAQAVQWQQIQCLELPRAQEIALLNNPDYQSAFAAVSAAKMAYYQQLAAYLPKIDLEFNLKQDIRSNTQRVNPPDTIAPYDNNFTTATTFVGSWLIFDGFARELQTLARRSMLRMSEDDKQNLARILMRSVAYAYYDHLLGRAEVEIAQANLEFRDSALQQASRQYQAGHIAKGDWLNFKILRNRALCQLAIALEHRDMALFALANLLGYPLGTLPGTVKFPAINIPRERLAFTVEYYMDMALNRRPDLHAMGETVKNLDYQRLSRISAFMPTVTAIGDVGYATSSYNYRRYTVGSRSWNTPSASWGVHAKWGIFEGLARYNAFRQADYLLREATLKLDSAALNAILEVRNAFVVYNTSLKLAEYYQEMLAWVFEQRKLIEIEYWAGHVTITRFNEAQSELVTAQNNLASALIELAKADAQLTAAVNGKLDFVTGVAVAGTPLDSMFTALEKQFNYSGETIPALEIQPTGVTE